MRTRNRYGHYFRVRQNQLPHRCNDCGEKLYYRSQFNTIVCKNCNTIVRKNVGDYYDAKNKFKT